MKGRTIFAAVALGAVVVASGVAYAAVTSLRTADTTTSTATSNAAVVSDFTTNPAGSVFLEADLNGRGEMLQSGQNMGDPNGSAVVILRISKNRIMYEITWQRMTPPAKMMLQLGAAGSPAGPAQLNLMPTAMPGTITSIAGVINLNNNGLLNLLLGNPSRYNVNMMTPQFPGGAVRGQFRRIGPFDFNRILHVGQLTSVDSGDQVVGVGNMNAHANVFLGSAANTTTTLAYAAIWDGVNSPTALNVNNGAVGAVGNLVATLFKAPHGLNPTIIAVAGMVPNVPAKWIAMLKANPAAFHTSLVTAKFAGGAARGQLFALGAVTTMPTTTKPKPTTTTTKPTMTMNPPTTMSQPGTTVAPPPTGTMAPPHW
ncbi:MAG TPA: CHRD domain-containing protein [Pseudonocardiaceae bacterium]|nr:CHRD domain-containing protein [Pseudonocardiaceae bacterium]